MAGVGRDIAIAAATAATATLVTALITRWLTKDATIASVAKGETPLPPGATPKTSTPMSNNAGSNPVPSPTPISDEQLTKLAAVATAATEQLGWIGASWKAMQNA